MQMLDESPVAHAEEWAIHDYEGFHSYRLEEYSSFKTVSKVAEFLMEHGSLGAVLLSIFNNDIVEAETAMRDSYAGVYKSLGEYAEEVITQTETIPANIVLYVDFDGIGRDMEMSGDIYTIETAHDEVHVFYNR